MNAKIGQLKMDSLGVMVKREAEPQPFSYETAVEGWCLLKSRGHIPLNGFFIECSMNGFFPYPCTYIRVLPAESMARIIFYNEIIFHTTQCRGRDSNPHLH